MNARNWEMMLVKCWLSLFIVRFLLNNSSRSSHKLQDPMSRASPEERLSSPLILLKHRLPLMVLSTLLTPASQNKKFITHVLELRVSLLAPSVRQVASREAVERVERDLESAIDFLPKSLLKLICKKILIQRS